MSNVNWNYDMDQAPENDRFLTKILVSDGNSIWTAYSTIEGFYCDTRFFLKKDLLAWTSIDLPKQNKQLVIDGRVDPPLVSEYEEPDSND